jgi:hypothetical protein
MASLQAGHSVRLIDLQVEDHRDYFRMLDDRGAMLADPAHARFVVASVEA